MPRLPDSTEQDRLTRIAIVDADKCKPKNCGLPCKKSCPVNRMGKQCIDVMSTSKIAWISEELCIGCGICVKVRSSLVIFFHSVLRFWFSFFYFFRNVLTALYLL